MITTEDNTQIFYKDWGPKDAQPVVFHHGWPLSSDDWDAQLLFFVANGYRVVAHDRRGHGRSTQVGTGNDMDHYAADASAVAEHLDLRNAIHIGHSTGGGEVARYVAKYGEPQGRVSKAVLISSVPPLMVKTESNPGGTPIEVFDGFRKALAANRTQFYIDVASGPFYGFNRPGADVSQAIIHNWWRQGMMGGALAHYEGIKAFSETDQRRPESDHGADFRHARGRRPSRTVQRRLFATGQAPQECHAQGIQRIPARHDDHACRRDQRGSAGIYPKLVPRGAAHGGPNPLAQRKADRDVLTGKMPDAEAVLALILDLSSLMPAAD